VITGVIPQQFLKFESDLRRLLRAKEVPERMRFVENEQIERARESLPSDFGQCDTK